MNIKVILLMAGEGSRFSLQSPKQFCKIHDKLLYEHSLETFSSISEINEIILVSNHSLPYSVSGGPTRQASSYKGLLACGANTDIVIIHDAVRPFVTTKIIKETIEAAIKYQAVDTCIPSPDTLVHTKNQNTITSIPKREHYWLGQTPQTFSYELIRKAHEQTKKTNAYDDCSLILDLPHPVHIVRGDPFNIKITYPSDLILAQAIHTHFQMEGLGI